MKEQRIKSPLLIDERKIVQEESMMTCMKGIKTKEIMTSISNLSSKNDNLPEELVSSLKPPYPGLQERGQI